MQMMPYRQEILHPFQLFFDFCFARADTVQESLDLFRL
jgi:hypothetical protein